MPQVTGSRVFREYENSHSRNKGAPGAVKAKRVPQSSMRPDHLVPPKPTKRSKDTSAPVEVRNSEELPKTHPLLEELEARRQYHAASGHKNKADLDSQLVVYIEKAQQTHALLKELEARREYHEASGHKNKAALDLQLVVYIEKARRQLGYE